MTNASKSLPVLDGVQVLRGIAAVAVLLYHAALTHAAGALTAEINLLEPFLKFGFGGVDLFFVISGFIITWVNFEKLGHPSVTLQYLSRRAVRIFPIFWICWIATAFFQVSLFSDRTPEGSSLDLLLTFMRAIFLIDPQAHFLVPQAWTLNFELLFYIVFVPCFLLPRALFLPLLVVWTGGIVASTAGIVPETPLLNIITVEFTMGAAVGYLLRKGWIFWPRVAMALGTAWVIAAVVVAAIGFVQLGDRIPRVIGLGVPAAFIVYGVASRDLFIRPRFAPLAVRIGDASYSIYLIHVLVLFLCARLAPYITSVPQYAAWLAAVVILPIYVGCVLHSGIEAPMVNALNTMAPTRRIMALITGALMTVALGAVSLGLHEAILAPQHDYTAELAGDDLLLDGKTIALKLERQGWATATLKEGEAVHVSGWAYDRDANVTARDLLVFADSELVRIVVPMQKEGGIQGVTSIASRQPGFSFSLSWSEFRAAKCIRIFAILNQASAGELYYKTTSDVPDRCLGRP